MNKRRARLGGRGDRGDRERRNGKDGGMEAGHGGVGSGGGGSITRSGIGKEGCQATSSGGAAAVRGEQTGRVEAEGCGQSRQSRSERKGGGRERGLVGSYRSKGKC